MKLNRLMLAGLLSISLSATSAYACDQGGSRDDDSHSWFSFSFWQHLCGHDHDNDQNKDSTQGGHQCNGGSHNGGSGSGSSGSGSGGSSSGGGSSTTPIQYK